jgi:hypothetical protein
MNKKNTTATTVDESKRNVVLETCVERKCDNIAPTQCYCCTLDNNNDPNDRVGVLDFW